MTLKEFLNLEKPEEYDFTEYTASDNYKELQELERFFAYQIEKSVYENVNQLYTIYLEKDIFKGLVDPDSKCPLLQMIYIILWDEKHLINCKGDHSLICGETMNSVNTTLNCYIKCTTKENATKLKNISLYYANEKIKKNLDNNKKLIEFINVYHTLGNFIPFPVDCNSPRGYNNSRIKDYWDLTLKYVYDYYHGDKNSVQNIYTNSEIEKKFKDWLDKFGGWETFIDDNYMFPFIDENGRPKELWKGHFGGTVLPGTTDQCNEYFKNAHDWILKRGRIMVEAIHKRIREME